MSSRRALLPAFSLSVLLLVPEFLGAHGTGVTGYSGNPVTNLGESCQSCHLGGIVPVVTLDGPLTVAPGSTNAYILTISGGQRSAGGFDVSATAGSLATLDMGTIARGNEVTHMFPKRADLSGSVSFQFRWSAPLAQGPVTLYGAGLSSDGIGITGDASNQTTLAIVVGQAPPPNAPPTAVPGGPYSALVGSSIVMDGAASFDPDGSIVGYLWDFGDGVSATEMTVSHAYAAAGTYTVTLTVTDDGGATDTKETLAEISLPVPEPPVAEVGGPYIGEVGVPIVFDGSTSHDPDGEFLFFSWDFGDGTLAATMGGDATPVHTYTQAGSFIVTLVVTDESGLTDTAATTVDVEEKPAELPIAVRLLAPRAVLVREGTTRMIPLLAVVDVSRLPAGTEAEGRVIVFKNDEPVAEASLKIQLPDPDWAEPPPGAGCRTKGSPPVGFANGFPGRGEEMGRGHRFGARGLRGITSLRKLVHLRAPVSSDDSPSVEYSVTVELLGGSVDSDPVTTRVESWTPRRRR